MSQARSDKIKEFRAEIKHIIRSHPKGRATPLQLKSDLKKLANIDIDIFLRIHFGAQVRILDIIQDWSEFKLVHRGGVVFIEVVQTDHIYEMNKSAKINREKKKSVKTNQQKQQHQVEPKENFIMIHSPDHKSFCVSSSNESLLTEALINGNQKNKKSIEDMREILFHDRVKSGPTPSQQPKIKPSPLSISHVEENKKDEAKEEDALPQPIEKQASSATLLDDTSSSSQPLDEKDLENLSELKKHLRELVKQDKTASQAIRELTMLLADGSLTIREFQNDLQNVTDFPLKLDTLSCIHNYLPLLQRELNNMAKTNNQSMLQFAMANEVLVLGESLHNLTIESQPSNELSQANQETNVNYNILNNSQSTPVNSESDESIQIRTSTPQNVLKVEKEVPNDDDESIQEQKEEQTQHDEIPLTQTEDLKNNLTGANSNDIGDIEQEQKCSGQPHDDNSTTSTYSSYNYEQTFNVHIHDIQRQAEDSIIEISRTAEDAIHQVKRQAVVEIENTVVLAKTQIFSDEMPPQMEQHVSSSGCYNCGRKATGRCSGCYQVTYCGAFCQRKDWPDHHSYCSNVRSSHTI